MVITLFIKAELIEEKSGMLGSTVVIRPNTQKLNDDLQIKTLELDEDGYKIISVTPIISGQSNWNNGAPSGFSFTDGLQVIAQK